MDKRITPNLNIRSRKTVAETTKGSVIPPVHCQSGYSFFVVNILKVKMTKWQEKIFNKINGSR